MPWPLGTKTLIKSVTGKQLRFYAATGLPGAWLHEVSEDGLTLFKSEGRFIKKEFFPFPPASSGR